MNGYDKLSALIRRYPYLAVYRKFSDLCTENLQYLQTELSQLELELRRIRQVQGEQQDGDDEDLDEDWKEVLRNGIGRDGLQEHVVLQIRSKLNEYCKLNG